MKKELKNVRMVITTADKSVKYYPANGSYFLWDNATDSYKRMSCKRIARLTLSDVKDLKEHMHKLAKQALL